MQKWKKCPKCGGNIPDNWNRHEKCGWNVETDEFLLDMEKSIEDCFTLLKRIKEKYPDEYFQLDPTKIALSMFIQRRKEKLAKKT
jgi:hypothetical protein